MDTFLNSGQDDLLNLMPCTTEGRPRRPLSVVRISVGTTNGVSVQGRPLLVMKLLCDLRKAKAKQDRTSIAIILFSTHILYRMGPPVDSVQLPEISG